jgi:RimJ/RimL family protein N-acetyltransferase
MIEGERVRLRAPEREDLPHFVRWINDPEVTEFLVLDPPLTLDEEERWYRNMLASPDRVFSIETGEGRLIGNIGLIGLNLRYRRTEIGIMLGEKDMWSQGYGGEAIRLLLRYLFEELGLNRVGLYADISNRRAIRCYERCGFRHEGVLREYRFKRGRYVDCVQMSILRKDWDGLRR